MDQFTQRPPNQFTAPLGEIVNDFLLGSKTAEEWRLASEQANLILQYRTKELRELMAEMQRFTHKTPVETVMEAQSRMAALRWLIQSIEREIQRLDKAYRETAQMEQLVQDRTKLNASP